MHGKKAGGRSQEEPCGEEASGLGKTGEGPIHAWGEKKGNTRRLDFFWRETWAEQGVAAGIC